MAIVLTLVVVHLRAAARPAALDDDLDSTLLARLDELRRNLLILIGMLMAAFIACFSQSERLFNFLMAPLQKELPPGASLIATRVPEVFILHLWMSFFAAIFLTAPLWLALAARFVSKGLGSHQKSVFASILFLGTFLFLVGAGFGHYVLFPYGARFLTTFGSETVRVLLSVGDVFSFYARFVLGVGLVFQIPTVVLILSMLDLVTPRFLLRHFQHVLVLVFVVAAIVTPTPDLVTQTLLALPMLVLYVFSIGLSWLVRRKRP